MGKKEKIIIFAIIVIIIFIITLGIMILNLQKSSSSSLDEEGDKTEKQFIDDLQQGKIKYKFQKVRMPTQFFTVENCIKDYLKQNSNDNQINFTAEDMEVINGYRIDLYSVNGKLENNGQKFSKQLIVKIDKINYTYEVSDNLDVLEQENITNIDKEIEESTNNTFEYTRISDEDLCRIYYKKIQSLELENPEESYSKLDEEYKKIRFSNYEDYLEYINDNKEKIECGILSKYSYDFNDNYTQCTLMDTYNNTYIVTAESVMNFKIKLDTYTVKLSDYEEKYSKLKNTDKVTANCYIFMEMINSKDYKHAYDLLDDTFKQSNFDTLEKFKEYIKTEFYDTNYYSDSFNVGTRQNYFTCEFDIRSGNNKVAQKKKLTIIMKLYDKMDFKMSFNFE